MSENPPDGHDPFPPDDRRSSRFFIEDPDAGWKLIGRTRWSALHKGEICVPRWAGETLRGAQASVEIDGRKVVGLFHLDISTWKFGDDGFIDQDYQLQQLQKAVEMNARGEKQTASIPTEEDVEAIRRCLGLGGG